MHLMVDSYAENKELMTDREKMKEWLLATAKIAGMEVFGKPFIYGYPWPDSDDWTAITAFCPLMESGIMIHCWPERSFVFIDLFTCSDVTREVEERIIGHMIRNFQMRKPSIMIFDRGVNPKTGEVTPARLRSINNES